MSEFYNNKKALMFGTRFPKTITLIITIASFLSSITNMMLGIVHPLNMIGYIICASGILILLLDKAKEMLHLFLVVSLMIYCPCVYIITEGFRGSNPLFAVAGIGVYVALYSNSMKWILVTLEAGIYIALSIFQIYYPSRFVAYPNENARLTAMCLSIALCFVGGSVFINMIIKVFEKKNTDNQGLMDKLTKANQNLEELSIRDSLTGIFNRRYLLKVSEELLEDSMCNNSPVSAMMIDIDHFKNVNDTFGHVYGDWVLTKVSEMIKEGLRGTDVFARYGGEEFVIILPDTSMEDACHIAERIRKCVASMRHRKDSSITISIGVAEYEVGQTMIQLIECADNCLYEAKRTGRDKVVCQEKAIFEE